MEWDATRDEIEIALNEAEVLGLRLEPSGRWCDLLLHVCALPATGPLDPDPRRVLRLKSPGQIRVLLRRDRIGPGDYGPVVPVAGLDQVEEFFSSLSWTGSLYGWEFLDDPSLTSDWPAEPSLTVDVRPAAGFRSLFWFNECGRDEDDKKVAYCIEGTVTFAELEVLRADATPQPLASFAADGRRYWEALHGGDERLSVEAQRASQAGSHTWRTYARTALIVGG